MEDINSIAKIKVFGVGGAGNNAVNRMVDDVRGVEFIAVNTDKQVLRVSKASETLCIGEKLTKGLGAGGNPRVGQDAAEESKDRIKELLQGTDLVFITAGMGGGTGTGAAPIIAKIARELGILTVAVVTRPFKFEGEVRARNAQIGISNLSKFVDCTVIVPNQALVDKSKGNTTMLEAFAIADEVLRQGVQCITDLIVKTMHINLDFADIESVMRNSGVAHMGIGRARGENRLLTAIQQAVKSPILETSVKDASKIIVSITGGRDLGLQEVANCSDLIASVLDEHANFIFGVDIDENFNDEVQVIIIATCFPKQAQQQIPQAQEKPTSPQSSQPAQPVPPTPVAQPVQPVRPQPPAPKPVDDVPPYIRKMREGR